MPPFSPTKKSAGPRQPNYLDEKRIAAVIRAVGELDGELARCGSTQEMRGHRSQIRNLSAAILEAMLLI